MQLMIVTMVALLAGWPDGWTMGGNSVPTDQMTEGDRFNIDRISEGRRVRHPSKIRADEKCRQPSHTEQSNIKYDIWRQIDDYCHKNPQSKTQTNATIACIKRNRHQLRRRCFREIVWMSRYSATLYELAPKFVKHLPFFLITCVYVMGMPFIVELLVFLWRENCQSYLDHLHIKNEGPQRMRYGSLSSLKNHIRYCLTTDGYLEPHNNSVNVCCGGTILPIQRTPDTSCRRNAFLAGCRGCCGGNKVYNTMTHICYEGHVLEDNDDALQAGESHHVSGADDVESSGTRNGVDDMVLNNTKDDKHGYPDYYNILIIVTVIIGSTIVMTAIILAVRRIKRLHSSQTRERQRNECAVNLSSERIGNEFCTNGDVVTHITRHGELENTRTSHVTSQTTNVPAPQLTQSICSSVSRHITPTDQRSLYSELSLRLSDLPVTEIQTFDDIGLSNEQLKQVFGKRNDLAGTNITENQWKTVETQTSAQKESNMRDSLGKPFQSHFLASVTDRVVQLPHSDVVMTLPEKDLQENGIECHVSSLTDIGIIRRKSQVADLEIIASPIFECVLQGVFKLKEHAVIKLPICSHSNKMRILRVESDQGANEVFKHVHDISKMNSKKQGQYLDTFYTLSENKQHVLIYTKVFSLYFCIDCEEQVQLDAKAYTFAGVQRGGRDKAIVAIDVVLAGILSIFRDYREDIINRERGVGRELVEFKDIKLERTLCSTDLIEADLAIINRDEWDYLRPPGRPDLEVQKQSFPAKEMVQCQCKNNGLPYNTLSWRIENKTPPMPDYFQGHVVIEHKQTATEGENMAAAVTGTPPPVCDFPVLQNTSLQTGQSYCSSSVKSSSRRSSRSSMNVQVEVVRKELEDSTLSSHYDSHGIPKRHPQLPNPVPELKRKPECSFENLGNRAVGNLE